METSRRQLRKSALAASIGSVLAGGVFFGTTVSAQDEPQQATGPTEVVTVTGSRIVRRDLTSNSPIVTIEAEDFETQTGLNVEGYLNQLPNYNPAAAPTTNARQDVQITPVNSVGIASISLRGFGPNRNLVLLDGKRIVPTNSLMVTDINGIPSALIERVETITGGASAVYGADAVGGVTNFILRDDFEGFEVDAQYSNTDAGDGVESRISALFGADLDNGRGNVTIGLERYDREAALEIERDAYQKLYNDPYADGTFGFLQGTTHYNCLFNCPTQTAVDAVFADRPAGSEVFSPISANVFRQFNFNDDGTVWVGNSAAGLSSYQEAPNWTFFPSRIFDASVPGNTSEIDGLKWHNRRALVSAPQERYSFFGSGNYELADNVRLFARATMAESETRTVLFGTNAIFGWEGTVPYDPATDSPLDPGLDYSDPAVIAAALADPTNPAYANPGFIDTNMPGAQHPVPVELAVLLNSRGAPGEWMPGWNPDSSLPPRSTVNTNTMWQLEAGVDFDLGLGDWTGELYFAHGQTDTYNNANGNLSLTRYRELIQLPDYGRNAMISGNSGGQSPGFGAADVTCTSGFYDTYFRGDQPLSEDCFDAINATLQTRAQNTQDIVELNFQGGLAELPAGQVRMAAGYQHRENESTFVPDILQSTVSFTDQVVGVYPTGYMDASTSSDDIYVEFLVPVLSDIAGIQRLELELGYRTSDYEYTDTEDTYKALINWEINDWARIRGGVNRSVRAPNIGELFLNTQEVFLIGGNNFGDPCALRSSAPYGAGGTGPDPVLNPGETPPELAPGQTAEGAASARLICEAAMGAAAANQFYNVSDATEGGGSAFNWVNQQGNENLESEIADTLTLGAVLNSPFDRPWLRNATFSVDYYEIEIDDAILLNSIDFANFNCYGAVLVTDAAEAQAQAASPECQLLPRNQALGGPLTTAISYSNQATIETAGADFALNWSMPFGDMGASIPGGLGVSLQATWLDYYRTKQSPASFDVVTDWKGSDGPNLVGTNGGAYDYRLFGSLSYFTDRFNVSLRMRYLPSVITAEQASQNAIIENNAVVAAGGPGITLGYTPRTEVKSDSYSIFDLSMNYTFNDSVTVRAGITNLFDDDPISIGSETGYPVGTDLGAVCGGAPGCIAPTQPSLPSTGGYNGGYYDTLGRRYFFGVDYRF